MKTVHSSSITFMDTTDNRKLEVYINSNLPTTQIYNPNVKEYSPDWTAINLKLTSDVFLDSERITGDAGISMKWYEKFGTDAPVQISTSNGLTVATNELASNSMLTYICEATYQGLTAQHQIIFTRADTGLNGADGTSVTIDGTAYYKGALSNSSVGQLVTLYSDSACTTPLDTSQIVSGDSYIVQGYLCVYSKSDNAFICTGTIQGPPGESAKSVVLNGDAQVFKVSKTNVITPATIAVRAQTFNTKVASWAYSVNGGQTFVSTAPNGVSLQGDQVTITGANITSNVIVIKASDGQYSDTFTIYKVFDGTDGRQGDSGASAPIAFLTNENITFSADAQGQIAGITVTTNVAAYDGTTKVIPTIGAITDIPDGITINTEDIVTINNELILSIKVENNATLGSALSTSGTINIPITSPVNTVLSLSWSKINTGATGANGTDSVTFQIYSAGGYILSKDVPSITLQTFAYIGDTPIEAGASYQWYVQKDSEWIELTKEVTIETTNSETGETTTTTAPVLVATPYAEISHTDVSFSNSYMCKMIFNELEYVDVVTIDDKNDTNDVFTSKPNSYDAGDIWIVGGDYIPVGFEIGSVLKAQYANSSYLDSDWIVATKYDDAIASIETDVNKYKQYISLDHTHGIKMNAIDANGRASEFSTTLSNTQLSFNQGDETVAYINNHKMYITEAEIESPLTVTGEYSGSTMLQAPTINLGSFSFVVESNGSLSIVSNL